jgi:hypothetical protein
MSQPVTYPCGASAVGAADLPKTCPIHGDACARILAVLNEDLSPWSFNGSEPMAQSLFRITAEALESARVASLPPVSE